MGVHMPETEKNTHKLYYQEQYLKSCRARVIEIADGYLALDQTIAYPEGGGQESDTGWIETPSGTLRFISAKLLRGSPILLDGFKGGKFGGIIAHYVHLEDQNALSGLAPGHDVTVHIDVGRRQKLTLSHSASHFLYVAALQSRPELSDQTIGCHIKEDGARFDFQVEEAFTPDEVQRIERIANEMLARNQPIRIEVHPENLDARTWLYEEFRIPCGGTHLSRPDVIGVLTVSRKKLGKSKERLICAFANAQISTAKYHGI